MTQICVPCTRIRAVGKQGHVTIKWENPRKTLACVCPDQSRLFCKKPFLWANAVLISLLLPFFKILTCFPLLWTRPHVIRLLPASLPLCPPPFPTALVPWTTACPPTSSLPSLMLVWAQHMSSSHRIHLSASPESWCDCVTKFLWTTSEKWCTLLVFLALHKGMCAPTTLCIAHVHPSGFRFTLAPQGSLHIPPASICALLRPSLLYSMDITVCPRRL